MLQHGSLKRFSCFVFGSEKKGNYNEMAEYLYGGSKESGSQMSLKILFFYIYVFTFFLTTWAPQS